MLYFFEGFYTAQRMSKSFSNSWYLLLLLICLSIAGCDGCGFAECLGSADHSFQQKVIFSPEQLQYHIGDTILISSKFSCQDLLNTATGFTEDYCGLKELGSSIQIQLLNHFSSGSLDSLYALENFEFVTLKGEIQPVDYISSELKFQIADTEYSLKFGIIPKVIGKYGAFISDSGPANLPGNDRCDTGVFDFINGNTDNHIELIEEFKGAENVQDIDRTHVYYFEVIP